jgi:hypothetical protein
MCFCFSDLIFYPYFCIDNLYYFYFCWKSYFFYAIYKNDGRTKKYLSNRSFFLYLQIYLELKKVYKKIVIFYYICGYHFTFFFLLYFIWFCSFFTFFFCPYFLIYIIFLFKLLFFSSFFLFPFLNFTLNSRKPWRERVYINCCFEYEVWRFFNLYCSLIFFPCIMHIVNVLNW